MDQLVDDIKTEIRKIGAKEEDVDGIINDIGIVVLNKLIDSVLVQLNDKQRDETKTMSLEELIAYLKNPQNNINFPTNDEIARLSHETWKSYLAEVGNF